MTKKIIWNSEKNRIEAVTEPDRTVIYRSELEYDLKEGNMLDGIATFPTSRLERHLEYIRDTIKKLELVLSTGRKNYGSEYFGIRNQLGEYNHLANVIVTELKRRQESEL